MQAEKPPSREQSCADLKRDLFRAAVLVILGLLSGFIGWIGWSGYELAREARRAWIVPTGARFDEKPIAGRDIRIVITFQNPGNEPAFDVFHIWEWSEQPFPVEFDILRRTKWPTQFFCDVDPLRTVARRTIYPSTKNETSLHLFYHGPDFLPASVVSGASSFYVHGCFRYRTLGRIRSSPYCLYLKPDRDQPIEQWKFAFCPTGAVNAD